MKTYLFFCLIYFFTGSLSQATSRQWYAVIETISSPSLPCIDPRFKSVNEVGDMPAEMNSPKESCPAVCQERETRRPDKIYGKTNISAFSDCRDILPSQPKFGYEGICTLPLDCDGAAYCEIKFKCERISTQI